tara:strand:- start:4232 stop:5062 length:831 start_codon:yes stop_codon:yes gene_type:complete
MTSIYYEKCILHEKVPTKNLIKLSQLQRQANKMNTIEIIEEYYKKLCELCNKLRYNRVTVSQHPTFTFDTVKSTNWTLELIRVAHSASEMILIQAEEEEDFKKKNKLYERALKYANDCCRYSASVLFERNTNKLSKYLNPRYHLSRVFSIAADKLYNMNECKATYLAVERAFQLIEIASMLWDDDDMKIKSVKYESKALLALANKIDENDCGERVALLETVTAKEGCLPEVVAQYESFKQQNEQVYYKPVHTDRKIKVLTLKEAFDISSKCFVIGQ